MPIQVDPITPGSDMILVATIVLGVSYAVPAPGADR